MTQDPPGALGLPTPTRLATFGALAGREPAAVSRRDAGLLPRGRPDRRPWAEDGAGAPAVEVRVR